MNKEEHSNNQHKTIIQGFWHGPDIGQLRQACLTSFVECGHIFELYTYEHVDVPHGVVLRDANEIIPYKEIFYYFNPVTGKPDLGPFSDLFRFKLLYERGGWWSDVDTICLSDKIPAIERAWARELPEYAPDKVGTSQIAFKQGDPVIKLLYERCYTLSKTNYPRRESLGPILLSETISDLQLPKDMFGSADLFYPVRWIEIFTLWLPEFKDEITSRTENSIYMPIYQSFSQYIGLTSGGLPPKGSYLATLCDKFGLENEFRYSADEVFAKTKQFFHANREWAIDELKSIKGKDFLERMELYF